jgi:hypothetical protein
VQNKGWWEAQVPPPRGGGQQSCRWPHCRPAAAVRPFCRTGAAQPEGLREGRSLWDTACCMA